MTQEEVKAKKADTDEKQGKLCTECFQVKPLTNICPNCEEDW